MISDWIWGYLANEKEDRDPKHIGLSSAGKCGRQLAYKYHGTQGVPLSPRARSIFDDGNLIQDQLRQWIHLSDKPECYYLADEETEVTLTTPKGRGIKGHVDGIIHHEPTLSACVDRTHYSRLLEIKSMGSKSYRLLRREGLEKSYLVQVSSYLRATKLPEATVLCKNKDTSDLAELTVKEDKCSVDEALVRIDSVLDSKAPDSVQRMYGPNEEGALPWQCNYCPFVKICYAKYDPVETEDHKVVLRGDYMELTP